VAKNVIWTSRFCNFLLWSPWALQPTYIFIFKPNKWIFTTCNITTTTTTAVASLTLLAIKAFRTFHWCPNVAINILSRHYYMKEIYSDELYLVTTHPFLRLLFIDIKEIRRVTNHRNWPCSFVITKKHFLF
jgi:hypothetical protein